MKRAILVIAGLAAFAAPAAHAGEPTSLTPVERTLIQENRGGHVATAATSVGKSPIDRIIAQEDARRNDPALLGSGPAPTVVQVVDSGGFHWGDAGIGAAVIVAVALTLVGTTMLVRNRRPSQA